MTPSLPILLIVGVPVVAGLCAAGAISDALSDALQRRKGAK